MELKDYQVNALNSLEKWFDALERERRERAKAAQRYLDADLPMPEDHGDFPKHAWQKLAELGEVAHPRYISRSDGCDRPIPHVCFKVPTGGGKTLLAAEALGRVRYPRGLVLWIVPSRAIYRQTKDALWNREHPYRQRLERASGGRVKVVEKDDRLQKADIDHYLCVMLLMFPAANRRKGKEFLRMFRDSGRYISFFPDSDNALFDMRLLEQFPDLEHNGGLVKQSLFNVIKMLRPVVILDEAHKAYGKKLAGAKDFAASVNRLNPRMVLEFSATPNPNISNLLVDISGVELKNEEMIKMPVQVSSQMKTNWQDTLSASVDELEQIDAAAKSLHQRENRYIRPIAVVRVERTGRDQRDGSRVHAEDVREYLIQQLGVAPEAIRVKSAQQDELGREDLLSQRSEVRWIITKAALMEGWDCPFAYLLVLLDNTRSKNALTQLVGRILRQPHARLTGVEALDRCYVNCWNLDVGKAVGQVRQGLEDEGMTGLMDQVEGIYDGGSEQQRITIPRRDKWQGKDISIPKVLSKGPRGWRELDHLRDILADVDWDEAKPAPYQVHRPEAAFSAQALVDVGRARDAYGPYKDIQDIDKTLSISYFARRVSDIVPNPWQAAKFVMEMFDQLRGKGLTNDAIFDNRAVYADQLRQTLSAESDRLCRAVFERKLNDNLIRFDLSGEPAHSVSEDVPLLVSSKDPPLHRLGKPVQRSLFDPVFEKQFDSDLERDFARHLDDQPTLSWWHRVQRDYHLQGWRRQRIYPDFVAFGDPKLCIFETKGRHLDNEDTHYKREVLALLEQYFNESHRRVCVREDRQQRGQFGIVYSEPFPAVE